MEETEEEKRKNRLKELHKHSQESFEQFVDFCTKDGVVDAKELFKAKKKYDKWWKEALERVNKLNKGEL